MHTQLASAAKQYAQVGVQTSVAVSDPHQLIGMLYDGAIAWLEKGRRLMLEGQIGPKCEAITRVLHIVSQLREVLNLEAGGELAKNMDRLYEYMEFRLVEANLHNNPDILVEITGLIENLRSAWYAIKPGK